MKMPIFVFDDGDMDIFESIDSLSKYIEPYDIDDNIVFDADGLKLTLKLVERGRELVAVEELNNVELAPEVLFSLIKNFLLRTKFREEIQEEADLAALIRMSIEKIGYS